MNRLYVADGADFRFATAEEIQTTAHRLIDYHYRCGEPVLADPAKLHACLRLHLGLKEYEVFGCLHLTKRHRLIAMTDLFRGTIDRCRVYAREVVKAALLHGAAEVVIYHNHPSGDSTPTAVDREMHHTLVRALDLIDVPILDHLIVGEKVWSWEGRVWVSGRDSRREHAKARTGASIRAHTRARLRRGWRHSGVRIQSCSPGSPSRAVGIRFSRSQ
jgi:DNA repair protein RadC